MGKKEERNVREGQTRFVRSRVLALVGLLGCYVEGRGCRRRYIFRRLATGIDYFDNRLVWWCDERILCRQLHIAGTKGCVNLSKLADIHFERVDDSGGRAIDV